MTTPRRDHATGYVPLPPTEFVRGLKYAATPRVPTVADLAQERTVTPSRIEHQGQLGSCVGHAVSSALECLRPDLPALSRRYPWQRAKDMLGWTGNVGVYLSTGCDAGIEAVLTEAAYPYGSDFDTDTPIPIDGERHDVGFAHRLITGDLVAGCWAALDAGHPIVVGTLMDAGAWYEAYGQGCLITRRGPGSDFCHAFYVWRVTPRAVICRNSWGEQVGPGVQLADPMMTAGDIAFTHEAFRDSIFEARELDPEAMPAPEPHTEDWRAGVEAARLVVADLYDTTPDGETDRRDAYRIAHNSIYDLIYR